MRLNSLKILCLPPNKWAFFKKFYPWVWPSKITLKSKVINGSEKGSINPILDQDVPFDSCRFWPQV